MSHTPGPWTQHKLEVFTSNRKVCSVSCGRDYAGDIDNARLIAAAPDLLDALKEICEWTERYTAPGHTITTVAKRAILKATGGEV